MDFAATTERLIDLFERFSEDETDARVSRVKSGRVDSTRSEYAKARDKSRRSTREAKAFSF